MKKIILLSCVAILSVGCASNAPKPNESIRIPKRTTPLPFRNVVIRSDYQVGEVAKLCDAALGRFNQDLVTAVKNAPDLDKVLTDFNDATQPLTFMFYVSQNEVIRKEANDCEEKYKQAMVDVFTRHDLYQAIKQTVANSSDDERLVSELRREFEKNGMNLKERDLKTFKRLKNELGDVEVKYMKNYNDDVSTVEFSTAELEGVSESFLARLKKTTEGANGEPAKYVVTTKPTDFIEVMTNAKNSEARRKMLFAYENRAADFNTPLINKAIQLRQQLAKVAGYKNWAEYKIKSNMAKTPAAVNAFLAELKIKLASRYEKERAELLTAKKQLIDDKATTVEPWDLRYLTYQIQKRDFDLDEDVLREYFPKDKVVDGMFDIYSTLFGVRFEEVRSAPVWAPDVKLYAIVEKSANTIVGYFYTDFVPRPGKYSHAAAFHLIDGRRVGAGYSQPASAIVANMTPPTPDRPALLKFAEVRTLFHEFGHIMHQTLTRAPYGFLSGSKVARDFVEAPSQMLENWVLEPAILRKISGYYKDPVKILPEDLIAKIMAVQKFEHENLPVASFYERQLVFALTDMALHTATGTVDAETVYTRVHKEVLGYAPIDGSHFTASFGHMMSGYDAGYYGYLWSDVYAQDMFTEFQKDGVLNSQIGMRYRGTILEQGNMVSAMNLISSFLGRQPNNYAFLSRLSGVQESAPPKDD